MTAEREARAELDLLLRQASSTLEKHLSNVVDPDTMFSAVMNTAARHEAGDAKPQRRSVAEHEATEDQGPAPGLIQRGQEAPKSSTISRMMIGSLLRRLRESREISKQDAAYHIRVAEPRLSRMEQGRASLKERDVEDLMMLYGVTADEERAKVLDLVARSSELGWWHAYSDLMPKWFEPYIGLEESAAQIRTYEIQFVPGLLQTEDYALALASRGLSVRDTRDTWDSERKVRLRIQRQEILFGHDAPRLWAIIDESVLHRQFGGRRVLREQIERLLELSDVPNITLQVVPYQTSGYGAEGPFTMLRFADPELSDIVYVEHPAGALYLERPEEIEIYSCALDRLAVEAEDPDYSQKLLLKARDEI